MLTPSFVVLTLGDRPDELLHAVESIKQYAGDETDLVLVANTATTDLVYPVPPLFTGGNLGIPGGRNFGAAVASGDIIFFLDDDAAILDPGLVPATLEKFVADHRLAVVSFAVRDGESGRVQRRHVPRLRASDPQRSSYVTTFLGGACAIRKSAFLEAGGYFAEFWYGHEETDLAWRFLESGWRVWYEGEHWIEHPAVAAHRQPGRLQQSMRNRVWLARRRLPALIVPLYVLTWTLVTFARARSIESLKEIASGLSEGFSQACGDRSPISWRTVYEMTKLGRPPVI